MPRASWVQLLWWLGFLAVHAAVAIPLGVALLRLDQHLSCLDAAREERRRRNMRLIQRMGLRVVATTVGTTLMLIVMGAPKFALR